MPRGPNNGPSLWASPSLSWEEVGPFRSGDWPFGLGSAVWVGVGPSFSGSGLDLRSGLSGKNFKNETNEKSEK